MSSNEKFTLKDINLKNIESNLKNIESKLKNIESKLIESMDINGTFDNSDSSDDEYSDTDQLELAEEEENNIENNICNFCYSDDSLNYEKICENCLKCAYCGSNSNIYTFEEIFIKVYESKSYRGFDFKGCTVEFNESTRNTLERIKESKNNDLYCYVCMDTKGFVLETEEIENDLIDWNNQWQKSKNIIERNELKKNLHSILSKNANNHFIINWDREKLCKSANCLN